MPLSGSGSALAVAVLSTLGNPDPAAVAAFSAFGDAVCSWLVTYAQCTPGAAVGGLTAAGAAVTGLGGLSVPAGPDDAAAFGAQLAAAVGDPSALGEGVWTRWAAAFLAHVNSFGAVTPALFVAPTPSGGPLTGTGLVTFTSKAISTAAAIGLVDPAAALMEDAFSAAVLVHIEAAALVSPISHTPPVAFTAPPGGGPITGFGSLT